MTKLVAVAPRGRRAARRAAAGLCLSAALAFSGCGEVTPLTPDPGPTPTPAPARANVGLSLTGIAIDFGTVPGYTYAIVSNVRLTESGGVAATIDYIRLDFHLPNNSLLERTQLSGGQIPGGTALAARGTRDFQALGLGFNNDPLTGRYIVISVQTTDARGNVQVVTSGQLIFG
jgi:hypothetical protein